MKVKKILISGLALSVLGVAGYLFNQSETPQGIASGSLSEIKATSSFSEGDILTSQESETPVALNEVEYAQPITEGLEATVVKYVDGDTTHFEVAKQVKKVRYLLIDTPEVTKGQPFASEAKARVQQILSSAKSIKLEYDIGPGFDHYGRDLMYVWADDRLVQELLAEEGLCMVRYVTPPNTRYLDQVKAAEARAQKAQIGIWSIENYASGGGFDQSEGQTPASSNQTAETSQTTASNRTVYYSPGSGTKYHFDPNFRGLRKAKHVSKITQDEAHQLGLALCGYED